MEALYTYMEGIKEVSQLWECKKLSFLYNLLILCKQQNWKEQERGGDDLSPFNALEANVW